MYVGHTSLPPSVASVGGPRESVASAAAQRASGDEPAVKGPAAYFNISAEGRERASEAPDTPEPPEQQRVFGEKAAPEPAPGTKSEDDSAKVAEERPEPTELSEEEQTQVRELEARDREVRAHEQAHKGAGGQYAGSINLEYERGPDGQNYAVGGHVPIDVSPIKGDPAATVAKMAVVRRAALAPADPSGADRSVAAKASTYASDARAELAAQRYTEAKGEGEPGAQAPPESDGAHANSANSAVADGHPANAHGAAAAGIPEAHEHAASHSEGSDGRRPSLALVA